MADLLKIFKEIKDRPIFVPYKMVLDEKRQKFDKIPSDGAVRLSTKEPAHWGPLADAMALAACEVRGLSGVGIVMTGGVHTKMGGDGTLVGFDFDGVDFEKFTPPFVTYYEKSPSGKGLHAFAWVPTEWAEQFVDSLKVQVPGCAHCEVYVGTSPRFLTLTGEMMPTVYQTPWRDKYDRIRSLGPQTLKEIAAWRGLNKAGAAVAKLVAPGVPDDGQLINLQRFNLSIEQRHLVNGTGQIDRSAIIHGLIIRLLDTGETQADILATMIETPALWQYCTDHRADPDKALQFAREEIGRAYLRSQTGMRANLATFNRKPEPESAPAPLATVTPIRAVPKEAEPDPAKPDPVTPTPAYPAPYPGPMADVVTAALEVAYKPQAELTTLAVLIAMAASCGSFYARANGSRLNLYGLGVLPTAAGKNLPMQLSKRLACLGNVKLINATASGEGLEDDLASNVGTLSVVDEVGHLIALTNSKKALPHHVMLMKKILELFGAGSDGNFVSRSKSGKESRKIPNPAFNMIGFTTPEVLGQALTLTDIDNGLAGRMLFVGSDLDPKARLIDAPLVIPESFQRAAQQVRLGLHGLLLNGGPTLVGLADDAQALRHALNDEFDQCGRGVGAPYERALCARSMENLEHIAGVLAVWDNPAKPVITTVHLEWSAQFVRASNAAVLSFVEDEMHNGDQQKNAAEVMKLLRKGVFTAQKGRASQVAALAAGLVPRALLLRASGLDTKELGYALDYLLQAGSVVLGVHDQIEVVRVVNNDGTG